jgi:hypothetical protein
MLKEPAPGRGDPRRLVRSIAPLQNGVTDAVRQRIIKSMTHFNS